MTEPVSEDKPGIAASRVPVSLTEMGDEAREEYWALLALRHCSGIGRRSALKLLRVYGSGREACKNAPSWSKDGVNGVKVRTFLREEWIRDAKKEWSEALESDARIILWNSAIYPQYLRELTDPPLILYARGQLSLLSGPCIAIVGTRKPTSEGISYAEAFGKALAQAGITVVSGMAAGIDRAAHIGAMKGVGSSIGILGTGIDSVYPRSNGDIFAQMAQNGLLLSEFPPGMSPIAQNFPVRNRIISGLCIGVLVVEAATKSGSLVTARLALEQNREVFAIPGRPMSATSLGCQNLIRQGARAVFSPDDILGDLAPLLKGYAGSTCEGSHVERPALIPPDREYKLAKPEAPKADAVQKKNPEDYGSAAALLTNDASAQIITTLKKHGTMHIEQLATVSGVQLTELSAILLGLEMTGQIARLAGGRIEAL